jgi:predicted ribosome quality control (RQC) complex YloA/Tae2 family protein
LADRARVTAPRDFHWADAPQDEARTAKRPRPGERVSHRVFRSESGETLWVGKGGADNDVLTFKTARPYDLWLHAKDKKGAHVVVPLGRERDVTPDVLIDAAHLAAHFSDARGELVVDVQYTKRGQLRKPRGSAPGLVVVQREKVLVLRVSQERLSRLLASEEA